MPAPVASDHQIAPQTLCLGPTLGCCFCFTGLGAGGMCMMVSFGCFCADTQRRLTQQRGQTYLLRLTYLRAYSGFHIVLTGQPQALNGKEGLVWPLSEIPVRKCSHSCGNQTSKVKRNMTMYRCMNDYSPAANAHSARFLTLAARLLPAPGRGRRLAAGTRRRLRLPLLLQRPAAAAASLQARWTLQPWPPPGRAPDSKTQPFDFLLKLGMFSQQLPQGQLRQNLTRQRVHALPQKNGLWLPNNPLIPSIFKVYCYSC